jgi:lipopolysaccharide biosynthesis glycosyltransferase
MQIGDNILNIMTSCDDGYAKYVLPQIASISENLKQYKINFYLFHSRIKPQNVELLKNYCESFQNIAFNEIFVYDFEQYKRLHPEQAGHWTYEMYYSLCCHKYLPETIDRILYIDAGDVYIDGDISDYYFCDFEDKHLMVTGARYKSNGTLFSGDDLCDDESLKANIMRGLLNSGSYMINIKKFRATNISIEYYLQIAEIIKQRLKNPPWFGDQSFLSVAFVDSIKYYMYPDIKNIWFMPYNFCLWFYDKAKELWYEPKIIHFAGVDFKPWQVRFSLDFKFNFEKDFSGIYAPCSLKKAQIKYYEKYWKYCSKTPIYEELNIPAIAYAKALENHYFPLCEKYNNLKKPK